MTAYQKRVEKALKRVEKKYLATLEVVRLKWLRSVYREALSGGYGFKSLGDLIAWIVDNSEAILQ